MKVAVAIITDDQQRILVTQRPHHVPHGGRWEFPGGKLEPYELPEEALIREIREEVGIEVLQYQFLDEICYQYPDKVVHLLVFLVTQYNGQPKCLEGQLDMKWIKQKDLNQNDFPEANHAIFDLIWCK